MDEGESIDVKIEIPETITSEWIKDALEAGSVYHKGRRLFVRPHDISLKEDTWLEENFGYRGESNDVYAFSATATENIPSYIKCGLISDAERINLSGIRAEKVNNAVKNLPSKLGQNAIVVWKTNLKNVEYKGGFNELHLTPTRVITRDDLPQEVQDHFGNAKELRQLPPEDIIGIYIYNKE